jgi:phenylalanyl-tRNA synthetase beta chain
MKVPLSWLSDYVKLPASPAGLAERLSLAGLEVAGVQAIGMPLPEGMHAKEEAVSPVWQRDKIVIGKVLVVERHPNADRLTLATVDYGASQPRVVVTGAPNIRVGESGQKVILALAGSALFDGHADQKVLRELKPSKIRGVPSDAMVCSAYELGISDEHEGIILLEEEAPVGVPAVDYLGDIILDLEVTPNMARCLSMIGVAREVAALTGETLRLPTRSHQTLARPGVGPVDIVIENPQLSARYAGVVLEGLRIGPAPAWMQRRLANAGMRPISNIVDITNYVMLEWGQPLHAFDYDVLVKRAGGHKPVITVRPARQGEILVTLDNNRRELNPDVLIIADSAGPIALAGVMGGAETEVSAITNNILLEAANFDYRSIRRTMRALNLPSEASVRFSRGVHPELVLSAAERAAELVRLHAGGTARGGLVDVYPAPIPPREIVLTMAEVRRILGIDFPVQETQRILQALEFSVEQIGPETLRVLTPPHRLDIQAGAADLIEDLVRIHGYDHLPAALPADRLPKQQTNRPLQLEERTRDILVDSGLQEVVTYSLTEPSHEAPLGLPPAEYVRILNPISSERVVMRHSLLAGMLGVTAANLRHTEEVGIFEIGSVYIPQPGEKLPREPRRLALVLTGRRQPEFWGDTAAGQTFPLDFFDLKGILEALVTDLHLAEVGFRPTPGEGASYLHPGKAAEWLLHGHPAGRFGVLHPRVTASYNLGDRTVLAGEFDLEMLLSAVPDRYRYTPVPRFPAALRDIAVIVDEAIPAEQVVREIRAAGGELLAAIRLFDVYRGGSIPTGTKSLAYALSYQAMDRTLTDKEVDKAHKKVEERLKHVLKAQIRGKELV